MSENEKTYFERLAERCDAIGSSLCIGLDPDPERLPTHLGKDAEAIYKFCVEIVEATADYAAAFKPNIAFFEAIGVEGWHVLDQVLKAVPDEVPVIIDAKRGDIGSTAQKYAVSIFDHLGGDAVTVNPYMGLDSVQPFLEFPGKGAYILCLTSNPTSLDFQMHHDLYLRVARKVVEWNGEGNCGMVVGATRPQFLASIQAVAPNIPLLIPGLGAQGGDLEATLKAAPGRPAHHLLFNVSRSVLYASREEDFGRQARIAARYYHEMIRDARKKATG